MKTVLMTAAAAAVLSGVATSALAGNSFLSKVSDSGILAGGFDDNQGKHHGFIQSGGTLTIIQDPSVPADQTFVSSVNDSVTVVGSSNGAFTYSAGIFTPFPDPPGAAGGSTLTDINNPGEIVGLFGDSSGRLHGFTESGGVYTTIDDPSVVSAPGRGTRVEGVNNNGVVVGDYPSSTSLAVGFEDNGGVFSDILFPGSTTTEAEDINDGGVVVGRYQVGGARGSFLLSGGIYTPLVDPAALPNSTEAFGINDAGVVVGDYESPFGGIRGFIYQNGVFTDFQLGVPEPASWVLMLVAFGWLGAIVRNRRRTSLAA
jgi:hypothetical protein